jgi:dynein heavy chain 1
MNLTVNFTQLNFSLPQIDEWKEKPWLSISPRKVRAGLDTLLNQCKAMPARLRTYSSYDYVTKVLKNFIKVCW